MTTGEPWTRSQLLLAEKAALGFYVTAHPLGSYLDLLQAAKAVKSVELPNLSSGARVQHWRHHQRSSAEDNQEGRQVCSAATGR